MKSKTLARLSATLAALFIAVSASAQNITYVSPLSGPSSGGTGFAQLDFDLSGHTMRLQVNFTGLTGTTTAAHIHAPTATPFTQPAGVATQTPSFSGFPLGVTSGTYDQTWNTSLASTWNNSFVTANGGIPGAESAFGSALSQGRAYLNIHSSVLPGGEISGFFVPVPEPSTFAFLALGGVGLLVARRRAIRR